MAVEWILTTVRPVSLQFSITYSVSQIFPIPVFVLLRSLAPLDFTHTKQTVTTNTLYRSHVISIQFAIEKSFHYTIFIFNKQSRIVGYNIILSFLQKQTRNKWILQMMNYIFLRYWHSISTTNRVSFECKIKCIRMM